MQQQYEKAWRILVAVTQLQYVDAWQILVAVAQLYYEASWEILVATRISALQCLKVVYLKRICGKFGKAPGSFVTS